MAKNVNYNLPVDPSIKDEFDKWCDNYQGTKGEKITAALRAILALYQIEPTLPSQLMNPDLSIKDSGKIIINGLGVYNFPQELSTEWEEFHSPSKDFSPSAAAAFLVYMVLEPATREALRKLAFQKDIKKARIEARKILRQTIIDAYWSGFVGNLSQEDKAILLGDAIQSEKKLSGKK